MDDLLLKNTKVAAYFIWERTSSDNAMALWCCAEDIASFFERRGLLDAGSVAEITGLDKLDPEYVAFVRHVAFRLFIYTNRTDELTNWYDAEGLLNNAEWVAAVAAAACEYARGSDGRGIRNEAIREYYNSN